MPNQTLSVDLTLYMSKYKNVFASSYIMFQYWNGTDNLNPSSWETTCLFDMVITMAADVLAIQEAGFRIEEAFAGLVYYFSKRPTNFITITMGVLSHYQADVSLLWDYFIQPPPQIWVNIVSGNGWAFVWCQAITWTNADILSTGPIGALFSESWIKL